MFILLNASGQDTTFIKKNAIRIDNQEALSNEIYKLIESYPLIMVGEMHGTNEPANLVVSLAELLTRNANHVQVGLEIPSDLMKKYINDPLDGNIFSSDFFARKSVDGRASFAWANIIAKLNDNPKAEIFFYDINEGDTRDINERDSVMYVKIKKRIQEHPTWKTITLSGNVHNMLTPFRNKPKVGRFLRQDKDLNLTDKILSFNHVYGAGSMLNDFGDGLRLHKTDDSRSNYAKAVDYEKYLILPPPSDKMTYTGFYFTREVTAAKLVSEK
jgi:hypothetical protein